MSKLLWEELQNEIIQNTNNNRTITLSDSLRQLLISSWISRFSYALTHSEVVRVPINFDGYHPCSFPFAKHKCSKPCQVNNESQTESRVSKKMCKEFYRNLAKCKRAQLDLCYIQDSGPFAQDTAFRSRRYCTRAIAFAIVERFNEIHGQKPFVGEFPIVKTGKRNHCRDFDRFENGECTLPRGFQCCIQTHQDVNCQQTQYLLAIRAQHNCFNCSVHRNYATIQARQLTAKAKKKFQETSCYLLTDGYFYSFITLNWSSGREKEVIFNAETQLDSLIQYGCTVLETQSKQKISFKKLDELPSCITLEQIVKKNVAVVSFKDKKYAIKCTKQYDPREGRELRALNWLDSLTERCHHIIYPFSVHVPDQSLSISEYGGRSLFEQCYCNANQNHILAKIVKNDITLGLEFLHRNGFAFVDVHPGNIVYNNCDSAKLIDIESIAKLNSDDDIIFIRFFKGPNFDMDKIVAEEDFISLTLVIHWIKNTLQYRDLYYNNGIDETDELKENLLIIEN